MALAVFGAGFGRTGTTSIKLALEQLGFGPCHHMSDVFKNPGELPVWRDAADGKRIDWRSAFAGWRSAMDWPSTHYWRQIAQAWPDAKVLLTVRPEARWVASFSQTIRKLIEGRASVSNPHWRDVLEMAQTMIAEQTFDDAMQDETVLRGKYRERTEQVLDEIPAERLLVYDVADGWKPLCEFLGVDVPATDFPRTNNVEEFWDFYGNDDF
ncbi:MAG: sulfotransferase [Woeseiaceae bacterium]|nr:sulfotransferase [Woeseiaceae bacterium]